MLSNSFHQYIASVVLNSTHEIILFHINEIPWQREQLLTLIDDLFQLIPALNLVETIEGADRMTVRFCHFDDEFFLNIECYCESIWIEKNGSVSENSMKRLHQSINNLLFKRST